MSQPTTIQDPASIQDPGFLGGIWSDAGETAGAVGDAVGVNPLDPFGIVSGAITLGGDVLGAAVDAGKGIVGAGAGTAHDATVGFAKQFGTVLGLAVVVGVAYLAYSFSHKEAR